jgi:hypothetical protein
MNGARSLAMTIYVDKDCTAHAPAGAALAKGAGDA